jgi:hypothetical protein
MKTKTKLFGHFQDLVDAYVGPFESEEAVREHAKWAKEVRGDGGELIEIVTSVPEGEFKITPAEDKAPILKKGDKVLVTFESGNRLKGRVVEVQGETYYAEFGRGENKFTSCIYWSAWGGKKPSWKEQAHL